MTTACSRGSSRLKDESDGEYLYHLYTFTGVSHEFVGRMKTGSSGPYFAHKKLRSESTFKEACSHPASIHFLSLPSSFQQFSEGAAEKAKAFTVLGQENRELIRNCDPRRLFWPFTSTGYQNPSFIIVTLCQRWRGIAGKAHRMKRVMQVCTIFLLATTSI